MATTLQGFVYDNAGNPISGATVQGYVSADNATVAAGSATTTDSNGKWTITTSDPTHIPMDIKITYGSNVRWLKGYDKISLTDITVSGSLTVGEDDTGHDVKMYGATSGSFLFWDESDDSLSLTDSTPLKVGDSADMTIYHDGTDSYVTNATGGLKIATETSGIAVTIGHTTSEVTVADNLTVAGNLSVGDIALDSISADDTDINIAVSDNSATALTVKQGTDSYLIVDTADGSESVSIGTGIAGTSVILGNATSEVTVAGNLTVSGTQTVVNTVTMNATNAVVFEGATADDFETTLTIEDPTADRTVVIPNVSGTIPILAADSDTAITATPAELNLLDGDTAVGGSITIADTDGFVVNDGGVMKTIPASDINTYVGDNDTTYTAGALLDLTGTQFDVDLSEAAEAAIADGDYILFLDGGATGTQSKEAVHDLATLFAGTGLTATSSVLAVDSSQTQITAVGTLGAGAISSGFGNIDIGSSTFDTTGAVSTGDLSPAGDIAVADAKYIKLGGSRMATAEPATNSTGYGVVIGFDSAGSVSAGDAVYINSSGKVARANAQVGSVTDPVIGIATNAGASDGDDVYVLTHGIWRMDAETFTAGDPVYLGETAGALTATAPSTDGDYLQRIGIAVSDDCVLVMPSIDVIEHA